MALHIATPLLPARELSRRRQHTILLKMDNLQPSGSFKIRGIGYMAQQVCGITARVLQLKIWLSSRSLLHRGNSASSAHRAATLV
jgi:threonine dehydratase